MLLFTFFGHIYKNIKYNIVIIHVFSLIKFDIITTYFSWHPVRGVWCVLKKSVENRF